MQAKRHHLDGSLWCCSWVIPPFGRIFFRNCFIIKHFIERDQGLSHDRISRDWVVNFFYNGYLYSLACHAGYGVFTPLRECCVFLMVSQMRALGQHIRKQLTQIVIRLKCRI